MLEKIHPALSIEPKTSESLDGLRGVAAVYVVLFHIIFDRPEFANFSSWMKSFTIAGARMVPIFFVMSGFFIALSMQRLQKVSLSPRRDFAILRIFRILPLWWILLLWMFFNYRLTFDVLIKNAVFYFGSFQHGSALFPIVPAWSLATEACFYILATLFLPQINRMKISDTFIAWCLGILVVVFWRHTGITIFNLENYQPYYFPFSHVGYFLAGIWIQKWFAEHGPIDFGLGPKQRLVFESILIFLFVFSDVPYLFWVTTEITAPLIVLCAAVPGGPLARILRLAPLRWCGAASFGIYILQNEAFIISKKLFSLTDLVPAILIQIAMAIAIGMGAYFFIERPFITVGKRFIQFLSKPKAT